MIDLVASIAEAAKVDLTGPDIALAYVGPDQILPLTSFLGALIGLLLIFWRWMVSLARRAWSFLTRTRLETR